MNVKSLRASITNITVALYPAALLFSLLRYVNAAVILLCVCSSSAAPQDPAHLHPETNFLFAPRTFTSQPLNICLFIRYSSAASTENKLLFLRYYSLTVRHCRTNVTVCLWCCDLFKRHNRRNPSESCLVVVRKGDRE